MHVEEFTGIIDPIKDKLYRYALRIVKDEMGAEDVVQEVIIKLWKKKEQFAEIDNKEAWCMTLTRNLSIDKTRSKKGGRTESIEDYHHVKDKTLDPYKETKSKDMMNRIMAMMETLPENQKSVLHLRDVEGYSYKEISEITTLSVDQVKVNLYRARKSMREKILKSNIL